MISIGDITFGPHERIVLLEAVLTEEALIAELERRGYDVRKRPETLSPHTLGKIGR